MTTTATKPQPRTTLTPPRINLPLPREPVPSGHLSPGGYRMYLVNGRKLERLDEHLD